MLHRLCGHPFSSVHIEFRLNFKHWRGRRKVETTKNKEVIRHSFTNKGKRFTQFFEFYPWTIHELLVNPWTSMKKSHVNLMLNNFDNLTWLIKVQRNFFQYLSYCDDPRESLCNVSYDENYNRNNDMSLKSIEKHSFNSKCHDKC